MIKLLKLLPSATQKVYFACSSPRCSQQKITQDSEPLEESFQVPLLLVKKLEFKVVNIKLEKSMTCILKPSKELS